MALKGDDLFASFGVMGGFMQPQGHVQVTNSLTATLFAYAIYELLSLCN